MKETNYNRKEVHTLKELRYEKARITIEMAYLEQSIHEEIHYYTRGGFLNALSFGAGMFASLDKWKEYFSYVVKGWNWVKEFINKKKEQKAHKEQAANPETEKEENVTS